ncbi:hypothetical protein EXIGLDRAFT_817373 [Exidia glandulosa HHB12029]|uniref:F-box domain-containing protein n=1 Tax=Exidia glandulosa HHB12029 TaxID=1314781 RepID=A0A165B9R6_EXIGL|nr:hypothetical protein EXIGLDRAFT_817373 [Exidia glandulosa HHB12029]
MESLSTELLTKVLSLLPSYRELVVAERVCRRWKQVLATNRLLQERLFRAPSKARRKLMDTHNQFKAAAFLHPILRYPSPIYYNLGDALDGAVLISRHDDARAKLEQYKVANDLLCIPRCKILRIDEWDKTVSNDDGLRVLDLFRVLELNTQNMPKNAFDDFPDPRDFPSFDPELDGDEFDLQVDSSFNGAKVIKRDGDSLHVTCDFQSIVFN